MACVPGSCVPWQFGVQVQEPKATLQFPSSQCILCPHMVSLFEFAFLVAAGSAVLANAGSCVDSGSCAAAKLAVAASASEDATLELLQLKVDGTAAMETAKSKTGELKVVKVKQFPLDAKKVWAELSAAVNEDNLQAEIQHTKDNTVVQHLQEQLKKLQQQFPSSAEIKQKFSSDWASITKAVDMENLQERLDQALAAGSGKLKQLQEQLKSMQGQTPGEVLESIRGRAAEKWQDLQQKGERLPDLDQVTETAKEVSRSAAQSVSDAWNSDLGQAAKDKVLDVAHSVVESVEGFFR